MGGEQIQQIPLDDLVPHPGNRKIGGYDQVKLEQLAESIRSVGVQQPAVVRMAPSSVGYEIVAGHRRLLAARLAGLETLPCVVRELDDVQVLKIQTIENLQREDVHPLDESDGFARLIEVAKYDVPTIAHELGKSPSYVYQRLKLRELVPEARELLEDGTIQAGHAIQIARLQPGQQKDIADWIVNGREDPSVRGLADFIEQEYLLDLSKAGFKKDDATLVPEAGACKACQKRTGYEPALFEDLGKDDRCLDKACYRAKLDATVMRRRVELAGTDHLEVLGGWDRDGAPKREKAWLDSWQWEKCKKGDEGAVKVLYVTGPERGTITWGKERKQEQAAPDPVYKEQQRERKEKAKAEAAARRALYDRVVAGATAWADTGVLEEMASLLRVGIEAYVKLIGSWGCQKLAKVEGWKAEKNDNGVANWTKAVLDQMPSDIGGMVVLFVKMAIAAELEVDQWSRLPPKVLYAAADALDIAHPEPKPAEEPEDDYDYEEPEEGDGEPLTDDEDEDEEAGA